MQIPPLAASDAKSVLQWLANTKNSWLLVLDNCDNIETDFAGYIPSRGGSVIVTTRLTECQHLGVWENVDDLGLEDAIQLLVRACGIKQEDQQAEWSHARAVVNLLGQHALALVHAGAYIKKGFCNLQMYCQTFRAQASKLMEFKPVQQASRYKNVYTTFEISAATLASSDDEDSQTAINLLEIFGLFDRENLEVDTFERASECCLYIEEDLGLFWNAGAYRTSLSDPSSKTAADVANAFHEQSCVVSPDNGSCDEIYHLDLWHVEQVRSTGLVGSMLVSGFRAACVRLSELSIVRVDKKKILMHPLMHEWAKVRLSPVREKVYSKGLCILSLAVLETQAQQAEDRTLIHHISACLDHHMENEIPLNVARALYILGDYLIPAHSTYNEFTWPVALPLFNHISLHFHPGSHTHTYKAKYLLHWKLRFLTEHGRLQELESCAAEIAKSCSEHFPPTSIAVVDSYVQIALIHRMNGRLQEAVSLLRSLLDRHPDLERDTRNTIVYTLASVLSENSMNQEVVPLLEEIYSSNVDAFSAPNLDSTLSALYLAAAFVNVGQNSPAIAILEPAVSIPNQNPFDAARSAYLLGTAYLRVGKHKEALFCFEDVMKTSVKLHEILGESTHLSIIGLVLTYKLLDMTMGMRDFTERMMDLAIQRPDVIHLNLPLWHLIAASDILNLCENSEPVIMMHDVTTMNSALSVVALQSALTETVLSATELNVFKPVAEIDKILDRERKARKSLTRCFARQRSIWTKMQLKINQALEDYPLLDVDGLEHYFEDMMETEVLSPEPPDVPFSKIDFQEFRAAVYHCKRQACARTLMKLDDYLRPFGEDVSDTTQSVAPTWSEITIELEILHADVQQLYK